MKRACLVLVMIVTVSSAALAADSPDAVIADLARAYTERNLSVYDAIVHSDFVFYFSAEDVAAGTPAVIDRALELAITQAMFSGQPIPGTLNPPIVSILLDLRPEGLQWADLTTGEFAGTMMRRYEVEMDVSLANGDVLRVTGLQEFYVEEVAMDVYQMKFWRDLGNEGLKRATESISWGELKWRRFDSVATEDHTVSQVKSRY